MNAKAFVDTNVLIYAYDRGADAKHEVAAALIKDLWSGRNGIISTQVLQEFYVNLRRKARKPVSFARARALVTDYLAWDPVVNDGADVLKAMDFEQRHQLSFWDALIVVAAQKGGAQVLYSEDFNEGQRFGSLEVRNPFSDFEEAGA